MTPDLSSLGMFSRLHWAAENLEPYQTELRVIYEDPSEPNASVKELCPSPEWMACALAGGILPSVEHQHNMKLELVTADGEKILTNYLDAQEIRLEKHIVGEKVVDYKEYLVPKPIGPMSEQEAINYIIQKDIPKRVWSSEHRYNRPLYKIVTTNQLREQNQFYRDCWRLSEDTDELIEIDIEKAKEVWKNKMRQARSEILTKLDTEYFKALEFGTKKQQKEIAIKKQLLRDVTDLPELKAAQTIDQIEAVWPDYLNG